MSTNSGAVHDFAAGFDSFFSVSGSFEEIGQYLKEIIDPERR